MLDIGNLAVAGAREIGTFFPPEADDTIVLFNTAFLVRGVGVGVANGNIKDFLNHALIEEFLAIVSGYTL